jgi:hypothetical protein
MVWRVNTFPRSFRSNFHTKDNVRSHAKNLAGALNGSCGAFPRRAKRRRDVGKRRIIRDYLRRIRGLEGVFRLDGLLAFYQRFFKK